MVTAALADDDVELRQAPYRVLEDWHAEHDGNLRVLLPDTFGTEAFLRGAPDWLATWTGIRIDSGDPVRSAELALEWWASHGENVREKLVIFSDGLDVDEIERLHHHFIDRVCACRSAGARCSRTTSVAWCPTTAWRRSAWCARPSRRTGGRR